jgi:hypothetical protein
MRPQGRNDGESKLGGYRSRISAVSGRQLGRSKEARERTPRFSHFENLPTAPPDNGADSIVLRQAGWFGAKIDGFAAGDTTDAQNIADAQAAFSYHENAAGTAGVLTLTDGSQTANLHFGGNYKLSDFGFAPDSGGKGTLISFV